MANMALAQAVLDHAQRFYDVGGWYVVAECWDVFSILEALDEAETREGAAIELEAAAIGHFAKIVAFEEPPW